MALLEWYAGLSEHAQSTLLIMFTIGSMCITAVSIFLLLMFPRFVGCAAAIMTACVTLLCTAVFWKDKEYLGVALLVDLITLFGCGVWFAQCVSNDSEAASTSDKSTPSDNDITNDEESS